MVGLPNLEELTISYMYDMKMIWKNQIAENSFSKLKSLSVEHCKELLTVFPADIYRRFSILDSLSIYIYKCESVEEIFDLQGINHLADSLKGLHIQGLPKLKHIWNKDPQQMLSCQKLQRVYVHECGSLKNLFPISIARSLLELGNLSVRCCTVLTEIVAIGEMEEATRLIFPQLESMEFICLPELKTFYPGIDCTEWPVLKTIKLYSCDKVRILASGIPRFCDTNRKGQLHEPTEQPFFLVEMEKAFPKLEELEFNGKELTITCQGHQSERLFPKLKSLNLHCLLAFSQLGVLQMCHNLEKLSFNGGSYEEVEKHEEMVPPLKHSVDLEAELCRSLTTLVPPSTTFQNLTTLKVRECNNLIKLVTSSTARSLLRLREMEISACKLIMEIVGNEEVIEDEIVFNNLKSLYLWRLPNLTSFCSGDYTFKFPNLEYLTVNDCPNMKLFSSGVLSTPMLQEITRVVRRPRYTHQFPCWKGDLNETLKQSYKGMSADTSSNNSSKHSPSNSE